MKKLLILAAVLVPSLLWAQQFWSFQDQAFVAAASTTSLPVPNIIAENFESGAAPSGWANDPGVGYWAFASPALQGSYSVAETNVSAAFVSLPIATNEVYIHFMYRTPSLPSQDNYIISLNNAAYSTKAYAAISTTGTLQLSDTTTYPTTVGTMSANTTYYIWIHYLKGTGADGVLSGEFQTTPVQVGSGNNFTNKTTATFADDIGYIYIKSQYGGNTNIFDHFGVATFAMPNGW